MGSSYHKLCYHWVCSTKYRRRLIRKEWRLRFHQYLGGTVRGLNGVPLKVGGVEDHVHLLVALKPVHRISDFVRELKKAASDWISQISAEQFYWQDGYSIFSADPDSIDRIADYIERQEEHHRQESFEDELKRLLEKHGIQYDPKYLL